MWRVRQRMVERAQDSITNHQKEKEEIIQKKTRDKLMMSTTSIDSEAEAQPAPPFSPLDSPSPSPECLSSILEKYNFNVPKKKNAHTHMPSCRPGSVLKKKVFAASVSHGCCTCCSPDWVHKDGEAPRVLGLCSLRM